jgi:DNA-binding CsgD family transcriptional regulator
MGDAGRFQYDDERGREVSLPLGGIGTGSIGLSGGGRLVDWEIFNRPNKGVTNGISHFAVRAERAGAVFAALGMPPFVAMAERESARIPGRHAADDDELTAAERRIAELVAAGRSNKDVAAELVLSVKTVEVTLTRVYEKLGVRSRAELAARFRAGPTA